MMKVVRFLRRRVERALDLGFGLGVQRAGRLVEDQDRGVLEDGAGDRDALTLAAGQRRAALADHEGIAAFLAHDELVRFRELGRALDLRVGGVRLADADVVGDRAVEQAGILEHDGDRVAQRRQRDVGDVLTVDEDVARRGRAQPLQQRERRRLARAGRTDERQRLAGLDLEGDVSDALLALREAEGDVRRSAPRP